MISLVSMNFDISQNSWTLGQRIEGLIWQGKDEVKDGLDKYGD